LKEWLLGAGHQENEKNNNGGGEKKNPYFFRKKVSREEDWNAGNANNCGDRH